jgi:hypothetical protein
MNTRFFRFLFSALTKIRDFMNSHALTRTFQAHLPQIEHRTIRSRLLQLGAASMAVLLAACAIEPNRIERPAPPPETKILIEPPPPSVSDRLLQYMVQIRKLNPADLLAERERARTDFSLDRSEFNRLKLALTLAMPTLPNSTTNPAGGQVLTVPTPTSAAEDNELIALTEPITAVSNSANGMATEPEMRALAMLIQSLAQDRKRVREQTREIQAKAIAKGKEEGSAASQQEARILRIRVEELEKQLTALKSIERSVNTRSTERSDGAPK